MEKNTPTPKEKIPELSGKFAFYGLECDNTPCVIINLPYMNMVEAWKDTFCFFYGFLDLLFNQL